MTTHRRTKRRVKIRLNRRLKHKVFRIRNIFSLITLTLSIVSVVLLKQMDILPRLWYIGFVTILFLLVFLSIILINVHRKIVLKVFGWFFMILLLIGNSFAIYFLSTTNNFMNQAFNNQHLMIKNTYYIISPSVNGFQESDIQGEISTYKETINLPEALDKLSTKYTFKEKQYEESVQAFDQLNLGIDTFMLIEESSFEIILSLSETMTREDYDILYEFDLYTKKKVVTSKNSDKYNIFVGGTDFNGLMDFNMIVTVNHAEKKVLLTSIPRDYYIPVYGKEGRYDKLSFMSAYGSDVNRQSLEEFFEIPIEYSLTVNTDSVVDVVDYLGEIEFCSDYTFTTTHTLSRSRRNSGKRFRVVQGCQMLNGIQTLTVARERNAFPGRDRVRQENCQKILIAIFKKLVSTETLLRYNETLNTLSSLYETNLPREAITSIAKDILANGNQWKIETQSVDGTDGHAAVHLSNMKDWVMFPDETTVTTAKKKIQKALK